MRLGELQQGKSGARSLHESCSNDMPRLTAIELIAAGGSSWAGFVRRQMGLAIYDYVR
jgi:hypothetical protein